jgi:hypothetical protein
LGPRVSHPPEKAANVATAHRPKSDPSDALSIVVSMQVFAPIPRHPFGRQASGSARHRRHAGSRLDRDLALEHDDAQGAQDQQDNEDESISHCFLHRLKAVLAEPDAPVREERELSQSTLSTRLAGLKSRLSSYLNKRIDQTRAQKPRLAVEHWHLTCDRAYGLGDMPETMT